MNALELVENSNLFLGGILSVVSAMVVSAYKLYNFHEISIVPRLFNRYDRVKQSLSENSMLVEIIDMAVEDEAFRLIFRHGGSPEYQKSLIALYRQGNFSLYELRAAGPQLDIEKRDRFGKPRKSQ